MTRRPVRRPRCEAKTRPGGGSFFYSITNPRGFATATAYQAFDTPTTEAPVTITAPETQTTTITRDLFSKPLSITRGGTYNGGAVSATRSYVYDGYQRLCKTVEPEAGATTYEYDGAGNLLKSATGQSLPTLVCNALSLSDSVKTLRTYDELNRVVTVDVPDITGVPGNNLAYEYYADGALKSLVNADTDLNTVDPRWDYTYNLRRLPVEEKLTYVGKIRSLVPDRRERSGTLMDQIRDLDLAMWPEICSALMQVRSGSTLCRPAGAHPVKRTWDTSSANSIVCTEQ
jgi:YD repeat-containing protein